MSTGKKAMFVDEDLTLLRVFASRCLVWGANSSVGDIIGRVVDPCTDELGQLSLD